MNKAIENQDAIAFIDFFIVLYDLSLIHEQKPTPKLFTSTINDSRNTIDYYDIISTKFLSLLKNNITYFCFSTIQDRIAILGINGGNYGIPMLHENWDFQSLDKLSDKILSLSKSDILSDSEKFDEQHKISDIFDLNQNCSTPIGVVSDIYTTSLPINLMKFSNNFIFLKYPIFQFIIHNYKTLNSNKFNCSLWAPCTSGDTQINLVYSNLEQTILDFNINTNTSTTFPENSNANIKIIIAHGGENIDQTEKISASGSYGDTNIYHYMNFEDNLKNTPIVILFVCHSAKSSQKLFHSQINSLITTLIKNDVQVVIAPKWSLHVDIPSIWLPEFLDNMESGASSLEAFHSASLNVYNKFKDCQFWSNLHYFGNPEIYLTPRED